MLYYPITNVVIFKIRNLIGTFFLGGSGFRKMHVA